MEHKVLLLSSLCLGLGVVGCLFTSAMAEEKPVKAWVSVEPQEDGVMLLKPFCRSGQAMVLDYYLQVDKKGPGGSSMSKQAGRVEVIPNVEKSLSAVSVKLGAKDRCRVQLKIMAQGQLVADEDFWLGPPGR